MRKYKSNLCCFEFFFHHKLIIIVFIDQSFLIYGISMRGILNLIIPLQRGIYTRKSNHYIIFLNAWILPTCSFTVTLSFNFGLLVILFMLDCWNFHVCQIADIFRYVILLVFSGMSGLMTQRVDELFAALLQNSPVTTAMIREAKQEYDRLRVSVVMTAKHIQPDPSYPPLSVKQGC